jgi:YgiT-type zinc finger domain-containing protein
MPRPTQCPICGGKLVPGTVTHEEHDNQGRFYIFQNVPALVCEECGEYLLTDEVVEKLDEIAQTATPVKKVETPVYDYAKTGS